MKALTNFIVRLEKRWALFSYLVIVVLLLSGCAGEIKSKTYTVGVVNLAPAFDPILEGFKNGMEDAGYIEGRNIEYIYDGPAANPDVLDEVVMDLKTRQVDLVLSFGTLATLRSKEGLEGTDIPIIFGPVTDPVASGIVPEIKKPGGNITGIQTGNPTPKRLEWLLNIAPDINKVYVFHNPDDNSSVQALAALTDTASILGVELIVYQASTLEEIVDGLDKIPDDVDAIFINASATFERNINEFITIANAGKLPLAAPATANTWDGALTSFGHDNTPLGLQASRLANQIFHGSEPGELPVESAELFLAINLKTAEVIDLTISDAILHQADIIVR